MIVEFLFPLFYLLVRIFWHILVFLSCHSSFCVVVSKNMFKNQIYFNLTENNMISKSALQILMKTQIERS